MADTKTNSKAALIAELNGLLADHFALFVKTKNFHWHVKGPRFRDLHLLFDEQALEIRDQIDAIGERVRKQGGDTLTSIGSVSQHTKVKDQDSTALSAEDMIAELRDDNQAMVERLKGMKPLAEQAGDNATDGLLDDWTDMAEERVWFLKSLLG
ncbi:Dps family protein [Erythrobacter sanguineus]|jgi:starvation-inducible DNA-binding protein|uniref:Starvation-inducible DNA-binding protein n=1 Tax=Erythrobacter sanguineus TaxID=198312 RepID=A0A1M7SMR3_9SPHN|nr:DNA starvation/stationary phase protection protein [Erythrobacter sanguineus]MCR9180684.1 DNA starvation/stationary phase protection protein [Erythrobacteraceae bacterium]SHN59765.1 starvation-inducible DNA-binding protein [Erythrobacter sanguineus]